MSVHVHLIGRFGNNLFQVALGRIIAEKTGYQFSLAQENRNLRKEFGLPFDYLDTKFENQESMPNCPSFIPGKVIEGEPVRITEHNYDSVDQMIDFANGRPIIIHDFFQRWKYYLPYRDKIREWFAMDEHQSFGEDCGVFHIRHGDYVKNGMNLTETYYEQVFAKHPLKWFGVGSDLLPETQEKYRVNTLGSSLEDFKFIKRHKTIACSNSSFAWWAAFLSDAEKVFIPRPSVPRMYWSKENNQDLCCPLQGWELADC